MDADKNSLKPNFFGGDVIESIRSVGKTSKKHTMDTEHITTGRFDLAGNRTNFCRNLCRNLMNEPYELIEFEETNVENPNIIFEKRTVLE